MDKLMYCRLQDRIVRLERDLASALKDASYWQEQYKAERRRNVALRGQITKLRKRLVGG